MTRKPQEKAPENIDLLIPIENQKLPDILSVDCFGEEYDPLTEECSVCAVIELCGTIFQKNLAKQEKKLKEVHGHYLDEECMELVPWDKLKKLAEKKDKEGSPLTVRDLINFAMKKGKTKDEKLAVAALKKFIKGDADLYTKEGKLRSRSNGS